jgi:hypothetical protein
LLLRKDPAAPFRQPRLPGYFEETGPMRAIVALVIGGWFRHVLPWRGIEHSHDRVQVTTPVETDREADQPMWVAWW